MDEIEWLNTEEAANRLGITTRTLYRFMDQGRLPSYRFGRVFRLKLTDIEQFIEDCRVEPGTLSHLYPEPHPNDAGSSGEDDDHSEDGDPESQDDDETTSDDDTSED